MTKPLILVSDVFTSLRDTARDYFHLPTKKNKNAWEKALEDYKKSDSTLVKSSKIRCYVCGKMIPLNNGGDWHNNFAVHMGV